jgi:hypothetical protein
MDLRGDGTLANAPLAYNQQRAIALGKPGDSALNLPLDRAKWPSGDKWSGVSLDALNG